MIVPTFIPGKKYALDGATLQVLFDAVAAGQILPSDEYDLEVIPKKGTRLTGLKGKGGGSPRIWDVDIVDPEAGTIKLAVPGKVRVTDDVDATGLISIGSIGSTFAMAEGDYLVLEWDATASPSVCTLKVLNTWTGFPFPYATADSGDHKIFQKGYTPLWVGKASEDVATPVPGLHVRLNTTTTLERLAPDAHFEVVNYLVEIPTGQMVDVDRLLPGCGAG